MSWTGGLSRRELLAGVAGAGAASSGFFVGTFASFSDTESDSGSLTSGTWSDGRVDYTDSGTLYSVADGDGTSSYGVSGVGVLGPVETGFDGSAYHLPVVDDAGDLVLVAADGSQTTLSTDATQPPRTSKSILATATWNGNPLSVYYPGNNDSKLFRVAPGSSATQVANPSNGAKAALGAGDIDGDGTDEFVFVDGSATVRYVVPATDQTSRDIKSTSISPGSNNNFGAGTPGAVDGYGDVVPAVNGSAGLGLIDAGGWAEKSLTSGSTASKTAVTLGDYDTDGADELMFLNSNGYLRYLDGVGGTNDVTTITDSGGNPIAADTKRGVL